MNEGIDLYSRGKVPLTRSLLSLPPLLLRQGFGCCVMALELGDIFAYEIDIGSPAFTEGVALA